jgi:hypothetical protein
MQLELNDQEREELANLIKAAHSDLGAEIHHARDNDYRKNLRDRRLVLEGLLKQLGVQQKMAA